MMCESRQTRAVVMLKHRGSVDISAQGQAENLLQTVGKSLSKRVTSGPTNTVLRLNSNKQQNTSNPQQAGTP